MKNFRQLIDEVNLTLDVLFLFDLVLTSSIIFLLAYMLLSFFAFSGYYAAVPAVLYLIWKTARILKMSKLKTVEDENTNLSEKLRTAKDYLDSKNPFVTELQEEIRSEMKTVQASSFFNEKRTYTKIGAIVVVCILILVLAPYQIVFFDFNEAFSDIVSRDRVNITKAQPREKKPEYQLVQVEDDWYGEFSVGTLGEDEMQLQLIEANYKLTSNVVEEVKDKEFEDMFPGEVDVRRAGINDVRIEEENQQIVKNYFKEISK